jgi:hypothetical protein
MNRKIIALFIIIGILYVGASVFGVNSTDDKTVRSNTIEAVKIGASGVPAARKTTPRPTTKANSTKTSTPRPTTKITVKPKATITPKPVAKTTTTPRTTTKPATTGMNRVTPSPTTSKTNYTYIITIGGRVADSITIEQGKSAQVAVTRDGEEAKFIAILNKPSNLISIDGDTINVKYEKSITQRRSESVTIRYWNENGKGYANITKTIIIEPHKTHKYGDWELDESSDEMIRKCLICGYQNEPFKVSLAPETINMSDRSSRTITIQASGYGTGKLTKSFVSSDPKVATVNSSGKVTAKKYGQTIITVKVGIQGTTKYKILTCNVNIECSHKSTKQEYIYLSKDNHRITRKCTICNCITLQPIEEKIEAHKWGEEWVGDNVPGRYTHMCTKCQALGGGIRYSQESETKHSYHPSMEWSFDYLSHWKECDYPNCSVLEHKNNPGKFKNSGFSSHSWPENAGGDSNTCAECGQPKTVTDGLKPHEHVWEESIVMFDPNAVTNVNQPSRNGHYIIVRCAVCNDMDGTKTKLIKHEPEKNIFKSKDGINHYCVDCKWTEAHTYGNKVEYTTTATCESYGELIGNKTCDLCKAVSECSRKEVAAYGHGYSKDSLTISFEKDEFGQVPKIQLKNKATNVYDKTASIFYQKNLVNDEGIVQTDDFGNPSNNGKYYHAIKGENSHFYYKMCFRCGKEAKNVSPCGLSYSCLGDPETLQFWLNSLGKSTQYKSSASASGNLGSHLKYCQKCGRAEATAHVRTNAVPIAKNPYSDVYGSAFKGSYININGKKIDYSYGKSSWWAENVIWYSTQKPGLVGGEHSALYQCALCQVYFVSGERHSWSVQNLRPKGDKQHIFDMFCTKCYFIQKDIVGDCTYMKVDDYKNLHNGELPEAVYKGFDSFTVDGEVIYIMNLSETISEVCSCGCGNYKTKTINPILIIA